MHLGIELSRPSHRTWLGWFVPRVLLVGYDLI